jgi:hypothetical protein
MSEYLHSERHNRLLKELDHDPYHSKRKIKEPTRCRDCGAVFHKGRWTWGQAPADAHEELCPACHRIHDKIPAGYLTLSGEFFAEHKDEILHLIRNVEAKERAEHPLKRIMDVEEQDGETVVSFSDAHLTHGAAEAVYHAYKGELDAKYGDEDILVRATWSR